MVETMSNVGWQVIWGKGVEGEKRGGGGLRFGLFL